MKAVILWSKQGNPSWSQAYSKWMETGFLDSRVCVSIYLLQVILITTCLHVIVCFNEMDSFSEQIQEHLGLSQDFNPYAVGK